MNSCDLCVQSRARQDIHPREDKAEAATGHSIVSFDFGYASRKEDEEKICGLFVHDKHTGPCT